MGTKIEWTEQTWNPLVGCSKVSAGCKHCYAEVMAQRLAGMANMKHVYGQVVHDPEQSWRHGWNGRVVVNESAVNEPARRKKPTVYFVNSMSDLFHESVDFKTLDRIYAVMAACPQHVFQVLTKRPERMREYAKKWIDGGGRRLYLPMITPGGRVMWEDDRVFSWPPANVWHGVSVEDQAAADARIPVLLDTPSAVRFLSCEPLLGPVDLGRWLFTQKSGQVCNACGEGLRVDRVAWPCDHTDCEFKPLHWVIAGGESGHGARAMHPEWVRGIRDACVNAGVPFFFKQWGEWAPLNQGCRAAAMGGPDGRVIWANEAEKRRGVTVWRTGKKAAGRELDGREWSEMPGVGG